MNHPINKLPREVRVFSNYADQVKPIRVYKKASKNEGKLMSKGYMKMFAENRILPREPYDVGGRKYVDAVLGEITTIRTYRGKTNTYSQSFKEKLIRGLVLTPTHGVVSVDDANRIQRQNITDEKQRVMNNKAQATTHVREVGRTTGRKEGTKKMLKHQLKKALATKKKFYETFMKDSNRFKNVFFKFK